MKRFRIALVVLSLLSIIIIVLMGAFFQAIQEGKMAEDWMGVFRLLMAGAVMGNVFLAYRYARKTRRQAGLWALGAFLLPSIVPLLLAFLPASSSRSVEVPQGNKKAIPAEILSDNRKTGEKIACKACDTMILPTTANRTGGLCMPCSQGTRYTPSLIDAVNSGDKEKVAFSMSSINHKKVEDEFIDLFQQYTFEEAEKFLSTGQSVDQKDLSKRVINRASEELMRKYSITMLEMVKIVERASGRMSLS